MARVATLGLAAVSVCGLAALEGGYFAPTWGWAAVAFAWVALVAILLRDRVRVDRRGLVFGGGLAAFAAWVWASNLWSEDATLTLFDSQRALVYPLGVAAMLLVADRAVDVAAGVLIGTTLVCAHALLTYSGPAQLVGAVGYSNALGAIAAIGAVVSIGLSRRRALAAAALPVLLPALYLTYGRGPWLALAAGAAATFALEPRRRELAVRAAGGVALAAVAALALVALTRPVDVATATTAPPSRIDARAELVTFDSHTRFEYWRVALRTAREHPVLGSGAGTYERQWLRYRTSELNVLDAHSLYLETLAELGPFGLALLLTALGAPLVAAVRCRAHPVVPAAAGGYVAYLVHAAVDWDWEMPAVTLAGLFLGCAVVVAAAPAVRVRGRFALAPIVAAAGLLGLAGLLANGALAAADEAIREGDLARGRAEVAKAERWGLWSDQPRAFAREIARLESGG